MQLKLRRVDKETLGDGDLEEMHSQVVHTSLPEAKSMNLEVSVEAPSYTR